MSAYASLNGVRIVSGSISVPTFGPWLADVELADDSPISTAANLVAADINATGFVFRTQPFAGKRTARVVGGFGGWMQNVGPQSYYSPNAVLMSLLLKDAATIVGEKVNVVSDRSVGNYWARENAPARRLLDHLCGISWWIDFTGTTQIGATRNSAPISTPFTANTLDGGTGAAIIATENPADWTPGRTWTSVAVTTPQTVGSVRHVIRADGTMRSEVLMQGPESDRYAGPIESVIRETMYGIDYFGTWEYNVQNTDGTNCDLYASASSIQAAPFPLPLHLTSVPMRFGFPGGTAKPKLGSTVLVCFANGDPSKPRIIAYDSTGTQQTAIGAVNGNFVCYGDQVNVGSASGPLNPLASTVRDLGSVD